MEQIAPETAYINLYEFIQSAPKYVIVSMKKNEF